MTRPMFNRFRSPPESVFFTAVPTMLPRRSLSPSSVSFPSIRRVRSRCERWGERIAAAKLMFSSIVRWSSNASSCGM